MNVILNVKSNFFLCIIHDTNQSHINSLIKLLWIRWKTTPITTWCVEQGIIKQPKQVGNSYNHKQK